VELEKLKQEADLERRTLQNKVEVLAVSFEQQVRVLRPKPLVNSRKA
jgi:hypothetical protein